MPCHQNSFCRTGIKCFKHLNLYICLLVFLLLGAGSENEKVQNFNPYNIIVTSGFAYNCLSAKDQTPRRQYVAFQFKKLSVSLKVCIEKQAVIFRIRKLLQSHCRLLPGHDPSIFFGTQSSITCILFLLVRSCVVKDRASWKRTHPARF